MRGKRRNRSTWFPILGFFNTEGAQNTSWDARPVTVNASGVSNVFALPLIPDQTHDPADVATEGYSLRDYVEGQTCIIDRVVGKINWALQSEAAASPRDVWTTVICASALAVLPVGEDSPTPEIASNEWDPLLATNLDKPFLWRRTWILGDQSSTGTGGKLPLFFNSTNNQAGSVLDGPHLDTKGTKRAIRKNERLFMIHSIMGIETASGEQVASEDGAAVVIGDFRVLGRLIRGKNRSLFK